MKKEKLLDLVEEYKSKHKSKINEHLNYYKRLKKIDQVIQDAVWGKDDKSNKHYHQYRISEDVLDSTIEALLKDKDKFLECKTYEDIRRVVRKNKVKGFGRLAIYDASLRIGAYYDIYPDKIYTHCGTKEGAKKVGLDVRKGYIKVDDLPSELRTLEPYQVEAFFCIYAKDLERLVV